MIVAHPFVNPVGVRSEYSPTSSPSQHKEQTLKNVFLLFLLQPYINASIVHLIPDPGDFNSEFRWATLEIAKERYSDLELNVEDEGRIKRLARDDYRRSMSRLPERTLRQKICNDLPRTTSKDVDEVITQIKAELSTDPYALLQPIEPGEKNAQLQIIKGYGLEAAMYLAVLTESIIYTDIATHWQQLHLYMSAQEMAVDSVWEPIVDSWQDIAFPIGADANVEAVLRARQAVKFSQMRAAIRRIVEAIRQPLSATSPVQLASQLTRAKEVMYKERVRSEEGFQFEGRIEVSVPSRGFEHTDVRRLLVTFGKTRTVKSIPMALFAQVYMSRGSGGG